MRLGRADLEDPHGSKAGDTTIGGAPLGVWSQVSEEDYDFALGAVPPLGWVGAGFILGEAYSSTRQGHTVWRLYQKHRGEFWMALSTTTKAMEYIAQLRQR